MLRMELRQEEKRKTRFADVVKGDMQKESCARHLNVAVHLSLSWCYWSGKLQAMWCREHL